jgi:hypothetical protein
VRGQLELVSMSETTIIEKQRLEDGCLCAEPGAGLAAGAAAPTSSSLAAASCAWRRRASTRGCSAPASSTGILRQDGRRQQEHEAGL